MKNLMFSKNFVLSKLFTALYCSLQGDIFIMIFPFHVYIHKKIHILSAVSGKGAENIPREFRGYIEKRHTQSEVNKNSVP